MRIGQNRTKQDGQHSRGADVIVYTRTYPLIWRDNPQDNATLSRPDKCRNSIQGKILIVDDEGYVCTRSNLLNNGCCRLNEQSVQYDCDTCNDKGCCSDYERCVSCCLNPDKVNTQQSNCLLPVSNCLITVSLRPISAVFGLISL